MKISSLLSICSMASLVAFTTACQTNSQQKKTGDLLQFSETPHIIPKFYICHPVSSPIVIDGKLDDAAWKTIPFSDSFVDITGDASKKPFYDTKVKITWDDTYLYIAAEMEEEHIWGNLTQRDSIIYHDNDFEVFIDPDGDTHRYYELEINALNTIFDLLLFYPYRDADIPAGQPYLKEWNISGLKHAVHHNGTLNQASDIDKSWSVELAIPLDCLCETNTEQRRKPQVGDIWRINFSRVHWHTEIVDGAYKKIQGKSEENWVWSPQGVVAMHQPETWGYLLFTNQQPNHLDFSSVRPSIPAIEVPKRLLRQLYLRQHEYKNKTGKFAQTLEQLQGLNPLPLKTQSISIETTRSMFEIIMRWHNYDLHIRHDGKLWTTQVK